MPQGLAASQVRLTSSWWTGSARITASTWPRWRGRPPINSSSTSEAVQEEIDELRRKIDGIGSVNLEALEELERWKPATRPFPTSSRLTAAKTSLEKIIDQINSDSRRLFAETLQTVKGHFQQLFRDLFGGGHGDIVLEEGVNILESGMEIVARPPGKEPRSISLLSGGEKTLTCVASAGDFPQPAQFAAASRSRAARVNAASRGRARGAAC